MPRYAKLALAALLVAGPAAAQDFTDPMAAAGEICFRRVYDADHLARNPAQTVSTLEVLFTSSPYDDRIAWVSATFRGDPEEYGASLTCYDAERSGTGSPLCAVDCDGGVFRITDVQDDSILIRTEGFAVAGFCGEDEADFRSVRDDTPGETAFRLYRVARASCPEMAW